MGCEPNSWLSFTGVPHRGSCRCPTCRESERAGGNNMRVEEVVTRLSPKVTSQLVGSSRFVWEWCVQSRGYIYLYMYIHYEYIPTSPPKKTKRVFQQGFWIGIGSHAHTICRLRAKAPLGRGTTWSGSRTSPPWAQGSVSGGCGRGFCELLLWAWSTCLQEALACFRLELFFLGESRGSVEDRLIEPPGFCSGRASL